MALVDLIASGPTNGLYKHKSAYGSGTPILRIDAFYDGRVTDLATLKRVQVEPDEQRRFALLAGDIIVNRVNSPEYLGKSALVPELLEPTVFESNMMRFSIDASHALAEFVIALLQDPSSRRHFLINAKHAINQSSINQQDVKSLPVFVPPLEWQRQFAQRVAAVRAIEQQQQAATSKAEATFSALLARAFAMEVPQEQREVERALA
jgi:type I restriction enzyme S subunit